MTIVITPKHLPYNRRAWMKRWARRVIQSAPDRQDKMGSRYYPQAYEEYKRVESVKQAKIEAFNQKIVPIPAKVGYFRQLWTQISDKMKYMWIKTIRGE